MVAHRGFEGLRLVSDIWRGGLVGLRVEVRMTWVPRALVPAETAARADWLYDVWQDVDEWLEERDVAGGGATSGGRPAQNGFA